MSKSVIFTVPGTHESHVWVSLWDDLDSVGGRTVPKVCFNCLATDQFREAEVLCPSIGRRWPTTTTDPKEATDE